ncbi:hypothetical protein LOD99_9964 [Oopsacas minuta]|uniref:N-acetylgalactosaminide beta-1,3-galactosyltransferase n=1 Tax=Oopsacas minuta TaxID=111878 RepID=A0AAV7KKA7_9METZ|nr:hypothetical protein LOD99_9964 [Oopsacas minuta]
MHKKIFCGFFVTLAGFLIIVTAWNVHSHVLDPNYSTEILRRLISVEEFNRSKQGAKLFCWVGTHEPNFDKAINVFNLWGSKFDKIIFVVNTDSFGVLPFVRFPLQETRDNLWHKTVFAFRHIYENYLDEFDWFMKADDDTFIVVDNLITFLSGYNYNKSYVFGREFVQNGVTFPSGGSGYVFSRGALKQFMKGFDENCGDFEGILEDVNIGICLSKLGMELTDTRDSLGRFRFNPLSARDHLFTRRGYNPQWIYDIEKYEMREEQYCCASDVITFHYMGIEESIEFANILEKDPKNQFIPTKFD